MQARWYSEAIRTAVVGRYVAYGSPKTVERTALFAALHEGFCWKCVVDQQLSDCISAPNETWLAATAELAHYCAQGLGPLWCTLIGNFECMQQRLHANGVSLFFLPICL